MESRILSLLLVSAVLLVMDYYLFNALRAGTSNMSKARRRWLLGGYWFVVVLTLAGVFMGIFVSIGKGLRTIIFLWFFILYFSKIFALPFLLIDDIRRGIIWVLRKIKKKDEAVELASPESNGISRSEFLNKTGVVMAALPFVTMNYGILSSNVYDYQIKRRKIYLPNLPKAFEGIRIGQISDVHSGSFFDQVAVQGGIDMLNAEKCDVVFFTGDLVNDESSEMRDYTAIFEKLKAPLGVYSILGNHDYGDYKRWPSAEAKKKNLEDLFEVHKNLGWDLLRNENRILKIGNESIALVGVENWSSSSRFPKKGRLDIALQGVEEQPVKLLLSHDPSHWRAEVIEKTNIDMMFAGHTHGMQFGVQFGDFQWSPVQYVYPEWAGLYEQGQQKLYVNVGYGFIGYPGRIGILPEITIFELTASAS